jgi:hypothetical protein
VEVFDHDHIVGPGQPGRQLAQTVAALVRDLRVKPGKLCGPFPPTDTSRLGTGICPGRCAQATQRPGETLRISRPSRR